MKTLREIIRLRQHKYDKERKIPSYTEYWKGYMDGWFWAYKDLTEILEQNGFDLDVVVIADKQKDGADNG